MDGMNDKGFYQKPLANPHGVGPQGEGGAIMGQTVVGVAKPGIEPQKLGEGVQIVQMPVQPPVGK